MGFFTKDIKTLNDLFVHTLQDIYYAEQQIAKNLPDMISKATDATLKNGFEKHLDETKNQISRLEQVFQMHGVQAKGIDCPAIDGILKEASDVAGEVDDKDVLDAALIAALSRILTSENLAHALAAAARRKVETDFSEESCFAAYEMTLREELTNDKLNTLALRTVNKKAA